MQEKSIPSVVQLSSKLFLFICILLSGIIFAMGKFFPFSAGMIGAEVFVTILLLFVLGSFRYQLDKNALTYGAGLIIVASFLTTNSFPLNGIPSFYELDDLIHLDTMLFILGLTFFVAVIAQFRILESFSFAVLKKNRGNVLPTVAILTAIVSFASGILDGVSMIGLMIRTLVIILFLAKAKDAAVIFSVIVSTVITTVCGMWLAYGEPPNLIMKANLHPHLTNLFFLRYCLPVAVGTYFIVYWNLRRLLKGSTVDIKTLDVLDLHTADLRFLQASRHGEVFTPIEFLAENRALLGPHYEGVLKRLHRAESLGEAYVRENVPKEKRLELFGHYASEELTVVLDQHYMDLVAGKNERRSETISKITEALNEIKKERMKTQWIGACSFIPFIGFLIWHGMDHTFPLFWASFSAFAISFVGLLSNPRMRRLALKEAFLEYKEYLFLFPLFLSITLLQKSGFFDQMSGLIHSGIEHLGKGVVAFVQFTGACILSALLDNNVVADFASRALHGLQTETLHLFAMAQIAGYAAGGCWTHIGSAQSVVAFAFIRREIDEHYTPVQWMKLMTPIILEIFALMIVIITLENLLMN